MSSANDPGVLTKSTRIMKESEVLVAAVGLFLLCVALSILSPHFLTLSNVLNVLRQVSVIAVVSVGMTYVILTAGIDLSVGSVLGLSAVVAAIVMKSTSNIFLGILIGLLVGAACGFMSGTLITTRINMPPFIATLAMMSVARGASMIITEGTPIYGLPTRFGLISGGYAIGIPIPVIIMLLLYLVAYANLSRFRVGAYYYAIGGNQEAARVAGVDIRKVKLSAYVISGITAAVGGILLASRLVSIEPLSGSGYELDAIAAAVIGGTNLYGGSGNIAGTLLGAVIMGVVTNGLTLLNVSPYWQQVVVGSVIASVVSLRSLTRK